MNKTYNGHKNWTHWNVALHIGQDEGLYRLALSCIERARPNRTSDAAIARYAACRFIAFGNDRTPDGARYSIPATTAAMRGLMG